MRLSRRIFVQSALGAVLAPALSAGAIAAPLYPTRPVRVLVPHAVGGPTDILARLVGQKLTESLGQTFFVENISGAGGNIGMAQGVKAAADGYTILVVSPSFVVNPALYATVSYDPHRDFRAITVAVSAPTVLCVHPSIAAENVKGLVDLIRSSPGKFSFASPGTGTPPHLIGEHFRLSLGLDLVHVPFNSAGQAVASTLAGHTPVAFSALPPAVPLIKEGKIRGLAVTSPSRSAALPDTPTMTEEGDPEINGEGWFAFIAPAGTPEEIVALLYREIVAALSRPDIREKLAALGFEVVSKTPEESARFFRNEGERWMAVIRSAGIKTE
jgi:tripartite-type tricarboxylate transporter receptor subunit TctC